MQNTFHKYNNTRLVALPAILEFLKCFVNNELSENEPHYIYKLLFFL